MRKSNRQTAAGAGVATTGARLRQVVQAVASDGPWLESQAGLPHLLRAETEPKDRKAKGVFRQDVLYHWWYLKQ